jgi:hypothetical protein
MGSKKMKSKIKRVLVLEIDEGSPEYDILYRLVNLKRDSMENLGFSKEDYKASAIIQAEILKQKYKGR